MTYDPRYAKRYQLDRRRTGKRLTDPERARKHISDLLASGASVRGIADAAGLSPTVISRLRHGQASIRKPTETQILAVTLDSIMGRTGHDDFVPNVGARRRIYALHAMGHTSAHIAEASGHDWLTMSRVNCVKNQQGQWVSRFTHDAIVEVYNRLWDVPGPSVHARSRARKYGWPGPLAWDDDTMDDPNAQPNTGDTEPNLGGNPTQVYLDDVEFLLDQQAFTPEGLADRLGVKAQSLYAKLIRAGRDDLWERLRRNRDRVAA